MAAILLDSSQRFVPLSTLVLFNVFSYIFDIFFSIILLIVVFNFSNRKRCLIKQLHAAWSFSLFLSLMLYVMHCNVMEHFLAPLRVIYSEALSALADMMLNVIISE